MSAPAQRLRDLIRSSGPVTFSDFMEEALYGRGGYYDRPQPAIGRDGDFVTGSSISALFGHTTARLLTRLDGALGEPAEFLEVGFGGGEHLRALLTALPALSPDAGERRRVRAWDRIGRPAPEGVEVLGRLEEVSAAGIGGLIFSYELFDALPFHRLIGRHDGGLGELYVDCSASGDFGWLEGELSDPALAELLGNARLEAGQIADLAPGWRPLYESLAKRLGRGLLVTCDYGFERPRLLDERVRFHGTLACYRRQTVHRDPFVEPGSQDLTAHIDFTTLREAGERAGLETVALTRQARWLVACGLFDSLENADPATRIEARTLLDGEGMGEETRVLVQCRGLDATSILDPALLGTG